MSEDTNTLPTPGSAKGRIIKARVRRNGVVVLGGKRFTSPSLAGAAAHATAGPSGATSEPPATGRYWTN